MPSLAAGVEEGTVARWLKQEGETVAAGEVLAEIESDKAVMEMQAEIGGVLEKILVPGGETVAVNSAIGVMRTSAPSVEAEAPAPNRSAPDRAVQPRNSNTQAQSAAVVDTQAQSAAVDIPGPTIGKQRVPASPLARQVARTLAVPIETTAGSGPGGRVVRRDVERAHAARTAQTDLALPSPPQPSGYRAIPNSPLRKAIARRLTVAKSSIPHFYLSVECELDELLAARSTLNSGALLHKVSINDFVIKAAGLALRAVPEANASWTDEAIRIYDDVDISVAVSTGEGLITPIIRKADTKSLAGISQEMLALVERTRSRKLKPVEYEGGGFTISNLGMFGVQSFSAIINPPQSCILAIGAANRRPVVRGELCVPATVMACTLSVDHRSVDGVVGARLLAAFKKLIEHPQQLL